MFFRLFSFAFGIGSLYKSSPLWIIWCRGIGVAKETLLLFHHSIFFFHHLTLLLLKAREAKGNSSYYQLFLHPTQSIRFFGPESLDEFLSIRTSLLIFFSSFDFALRLVRGDSNGFPTLDSFHSFIQDASQLWIPRTSTPVPFWNTHTMAKLMERVFLFSLHFDSDPRRANIDADSTFIYSPGRLTTRWPVD